MNREYGLLRGDLKSQKYTEENLRAQLRELAPIRYDSLLEGENTLPEIFRTIAFHASFKDSYNGPTEIMKKYYAKMFKKGGLADPEFEE